MLMHRYDRLKELPIRNHIRTDYCIRHSDGYSFDITDIRYLTKLTVLLLIYSILQHNIQPFSATDFNLSGVAS